MEEGVLFYSSSYINKGKLKAPSSTERKVYTFIMGDALIVGRGGSSSGSSGKTLVTKIIQATQSWKVPKAKDQKFYVRIFGGGGGGSAMAAGGGGGYMNNAELTLETGTSIPITIGLGGKAGTLDDNPTSGGTTSFGTYLSANGAYCTLQGIGLGGSGGGGGAIEVRFSGFSNKTYNGGTGYQFGGGGSFSSSTRKIYGGNGGQWGGGGGAAYDAYGGCLYSDSGTLTGYSGLAGNTNKAGTNTIGNDQVPNGSEDRPYYELNLQGNGNSGTTQSCTGGGGGYGGNGGSNGGGGGGYGADGGDCGGGGGGYGGNGGDGYRYSKFYINMGGGTQECYLSIGGGGGGYGPSGTGGSYTTGFKGGGIAAGGLGGLIMNNINITPGDGGNGICIIQYYA